jgi:SAM-dependent methyltransferase
MNCRHCKSSLNKVFLDLGSAPPSNAYLSQVDLAGPEMYFPLRLWVCTDCWLVQTEDYARADELFCHDYAYFSSVSQSWLEHAARYATQITKRLCLGKDSFVVEVASNDGYLLKNFVTAGIPCLGIEPTASTVTVAEKSGIQVLREFFCENLARSLAGKGKQADLIIGNNVYAHVPDINDFTIALKVMLKPGGTVTLEFPHLMKLIEFNQFDTVYHEHFSYLSLHTVMRIFESVGLKIYDVEELSTHGGSLRIYGCHDDDSRQTAQAVDLLLKEENRKGICDLATYLGFQNKVERVKDDLLLFLIEQKRTGRKVAAYGAAAKGNTLLNYAGIKPDLLPYVCDAAPSKQGKYLPGSRIPILAPEVLRREQPDIVLVLPWNIIDEITRQCSYIREWGGLFTVAVPTVRII